jgi:hypothetical protein
MVDGRRLPPLTREIMFEGDPNIDAVAYDTELRLSPGMVRMNVVPGGTRTTTLTIENPGQDPVEVALEAGVPRSLAGVRMGDLNGIELSAAEWTQVRPDRFTLRPGGQQNVRVISTLPDGEGDHASYYANLMLSGVYPDGQSAGQQTSIMHLFNDRVEPTIEAVVEQLNLAEVGVGLYAVEARLVNTGSTHVEPVGRVSLINPRGSASWTADLTGETGFLLPLGQRVLGSEIDFSDVEPGFYALRASINLGEGVTVERQQIVEVGRAEVEGPEGTVIAPVVSMLEGQELPVDDEMEGSDG